MKKNMLLLFLLILVSTGMVFAQETKEETKKHTEYDVDNDGNVFRVDVDRKIVTTTTTTNDRHRLGKMPPQELINGYKVGAWQIGKVLDGETEGATLDFYLESRVIRVFPWFEFVGVALGKELVYIDDEWSVRDLLITEDSTTKIMGFTHMLLFVLLFFVPVVLTLVFVVLNKDKPKRIIVLAGMFLLMVTVVYAIGFVTPNKYLVGMLFLMSGLFFLSRKIFLFFKKDKLFVGNHLGSLATLFMMIGASIASEVTLGPTLLLEHLLFIGALFLVSFPVWLVSRLFIKTKFEDGDPTQRK